nr:unnamed protein product [Callosobruchus analis]
MNCHSVSRNDEEITAIIDDYIDKVFDNVHRFAVTHGLDPMALPNMNHSGILGSHVILTNGTFKGISTLRRKSHVKLIYNHKTRVINFHYHYDLGAALVKEKGGFTGIMKDYSVTIDMNFDFKTYRLKMAKPMWLNGIVIVEFDGTYLAIVKTILGSLVTTVLTPLVVNPILSGIVSKMGNKVVTTINDAIDKFLHPNSTKAVNNLWE